MFSNVSNQMSGLGSSLGSWFKKEEAENKEEPPKEGATPAPAAPAEGQDEPSPASVNVSEKSVKGSADENEDAGSQHSG